MSEETTTENAPQVESAPAAEEPKTGIDSLPEWAQKEIKAVRKEAAGYREKLREAEPLITKATEEIESKKTETQKLAEALELVKRENDEFRSELTRKDVMSSYELPPQAAEFLTGTDRDSMAATAEKLKTLLGGSSVESPLRTTPVKNLQSGGSAVTAEANTFDAAEIAKAVLAARRI
ncbi:hypothetical protein O1L55_20685 [Streptomyces albulus]|nr:hypothetical protein [Streptomyces noursei]